MPGICFIYRNIYVYIIRLTTKVFINNSLLVISGKMIDQSVLEYFFENGQNSQVILEPTGKIIHANESFITLLKKKPTDIQDKDFGDLENLGYLKILLKAGGTIRDKIIEGKDISVLATIQTSTEKFETKEDVA